MHVGTPIKGPVAGVNVVPLIDVLLVLIIIFMVITPLAPKGLPALIPQPAKDGGHPEPGVIVVHVGAGGALQINHEKESWETVGARLRDIFAERAEKVAFVQGDAPVEFADVARVISIMRGAGIEKVGLLTPKTQAGG
jgi:biopolymer transport protein TolR